MPTANIAGLRAYYVGSGEPLVLLHGLGTGSDAWGPVLAPLAARHEVLAVDLPGFGGSPPLPDGTLPTPEALADTVQRVLDELGLLAAHVCGNSLGGWIALELARRRRARSLVLVSPAGFWNEDERRFALASLKAAHMQAQVLAPAGRAAMAVPPLRTAFFAQIRRRPRRLSVREAAHQVKDVRQARVRAHPGCDARRSARRPARGDALPDPDPVGHPRPPASHPAVQARARSDSRRPARAAAGSGTSPWRTTPHASPKRSSTSQGRADRAGVAPLISLERALRRRPARSSSGTRKRR